MALPAGTSYSGSSAVGPQTIGTRDYGGTGGVRVSYGMSLSDILENPVGLAIIAVAVITIVKVMK